MSNKAGNIGIVVVATNSYFILGLRFIQKFAKHYKGKYNITFYFFSDTDPRPYIKDIDLVFIEQKHTTWVEGTNSKFKNILTLAESKSDYLYYFDSDTNIDKDFDESWFLGDLVGGEHFGNKDFMKNAKPFDRNPRSRAYIPQTTNLPQIYYYGAFFGGAKLKVINFCNILRDNQIADKKINYEPGVNDESYINQYFHFNPPSKIVASENFEFLISDKGGIGETRNTSLDTTFIKQELLNNPGCTFELANGELKILS